MAAFIRFFEERISRRGNANARQQNLQDAFSEREELLLVRMAWEFDSNPIRDYLDLCRRMQRCQLFSEAKRIYDLVVNILYYWNCQEDDIIVYLLNTVCVQTITKEYVLIGDNLTCRIDYVLYQSMKSRFDWWGLYTMSCHQETDFENAPVLTSLIYGRLSNLKVLLKYGFQITLPSNRQMNTFTSMLQNLLYFNGHTQCYSINAHLSRRGSWQRKRSFLILEIFVVIYTAQAIPSAFSRFVECLQLVWDSIPDPYVSQNEMHAVLLDICGRSANASLLQLCDTYNYILKENSSETKPRTLMHLSRCKVRDLLRRNFQLPIGIAALEIPEMLKSYLKLTL